MAQAAQADTSRSVKRRGPRQRHPIAQKLAIIRECLEPGASLAGVALTHRVNANMVRKWVVKYQQGGFGNFDDTSTTMLPVVVKSEPVARSTRAKPGTRIEIELRRGVLRIDDADAELLDTLITVLSA